MAQWSSATGGVWQKRPGWVAAWIIACASLTCTSVEFDRGLFNPCAVPQGLGLIEALKNVYDAGSLVEELTGGEVVRCG